MHNLPRALFVSHGGGPLPLLGDPGHAELVACLQAIAGRIARPSAIIVVSAHWESDTAAVTTAERPGLIYDYSGFAPAAYRIQYPCAGHPALARRLLNQLDAAGIAARADAARGFDHGLFVPLKLMYPQADIPCIQLSLIGSLDPLAHIELGRALQGLADPSLLLIGSGFSFHNMRAFFAPDSAESRSANQAFETWLHESCCDPLLSEAQRLERLIHWSAAPGARYCHPREEHLLPLQVCYGYAGRACDQAYRLNILNKTASLYLWDSGAEQLPG